MAIHTPQLATFQRTPPGSTGHLRGFGHLPSLDVTQVDGRRVPKGAWRFWGQVLGSPQINPVVNWGYILSYVGPYKKINGRENQKWVVFLGVKFFDLTLEGIFFGITRNFGIFLGSLWWVH